MLDQASPQMESIDIADNRLSGCERTTTIALHVGQTYVEYLKCTTLMCHMPQKPYTMHPQRARFMKRTTYDGPLPPLRRILYAPTIIQPKKNHRRW